MNSTLYQALTLVIPLVFAIVFHEVAHGRVAHLLGDPTAAERGRLSLNPIRHVDPVGTVVLPGLLALMKAPVFGWARPVPVNKFRLRNPRFGMMAVAAAGPLTNLVMAGVGAVLLGLFARAHGSDQLPHGVPGFIFVNLLNFLQINIFLALFNLLPIPPFDGSHIIEGLLPRRMAIGFDTFRRLGMLPIILLLLVLPRFIPGFDLIGRFVVPPVDWMTGHYLALAAAVSGI